MVPAAEGRVWADSSQIWFGEGVPSRWPAGEKKRWDAVGSTRPVESRRKVTVEVVSADLAEEERRAGRGAAGGVTETPKRSFRADLARRRQTVAPATAGRRDGVQRGAFDQVCGEEMEGCRDVVPGEFFVRRKRGAWIAVAPAAEGC